MIITSDSYNVIFDDTSNETKTVISKDHIKLIRFDNDRVLIADNTDRQENNKRLLIKFSDVSSPVYANGDAMLDDLILKKDSLGSSQKELETIKLHVAGIDAELSQLHTSFNNEDFASETTLASLLPTHETSAANTTTVSLGIGATFTGVVDSSNFADVMVHVETDQNGTLFFDFTQDGVNFDSFPFTGFTHMANIPSFHVAVKGGQQFRIRFENTSGIAQTFLRAYTYFGSFKKPNAPIGTAVSNTSDATVVHAVLTGQDSLGDFPNIGATTGGNLKVTPHDSSTGSRQIIDLNGSAKVAQAIILVGDKFGGFAPNALQWDFTDLVGSGSSIELDGTQRIETGTTADSEMRFQSQKRARFMISQFNIFHGGVEVNNISDTQCERRFGAFDPINASQNGCYFALIDGGWNVGYSKSGVETLIPEAGWNGTNKSLFNAAPDLSVYEIQYNAGSIFFFQGGNFLHVVKGLPSPYAALYDFHASCEVKNTDGNTTNNCIDFRALGIFRLGGEREELISRAFTADTLVKSGAGYVGEVSLSRNGSAGGAGKLEVFDGTDATGDLMRVIDVGGDKIEPSLINGSTSFGLFIRITGSGTNTANITYG